MNVVILIVLVFVIFIVLFGMGLSKQKNGDILLIEISDNVVNFYLSDDKYLTFDITKFENNKEKIYSQIKKILKNRAFELKNLVTKVQFFKDGNKEKEKELLNIIKGIK